LPSATKRGPAPVAALLFQETEQSVCMRQIAAEQHRLAPEPALSQTQGRPTKRERRTGEKWREGDWGERWSVSVDD
jgi:ribosome-associated heat shock protein Hsp15